MNGRDERPEVRGNAEGRANAEGRGSTGNEGDEQDGSSRSLLSDVSPAQVTGGALASVTAAFLGSRLGVAGTFIGAGLTSVVITVGGALYQRSLERGKEKAKVAANRAAERRNRVARTTVVDPRAERNAVAAAEPVQRTAAPPSQQENPATRRHGASSGEAAEEAPRANEAARGAVWPGGEHVVDADSAQRTCWSPDGRQDLRADRTARVTRDDAVRSLRWDGTRFVPQEAQSSQGAQPPQESQSSQGAQPPQESQSSQGAQPPQSAPAHRTTGGPAQRPDAPGATERAAGQQSPGAQHPYGQRSPGARRAGDPHGATPQPARTGSRGGEAGPAGQRSGQQHAETAPPANGRRRSPLRWVALGATSLAIFVLGMLVITGYEAFTGSPLSGGDSGTTIGRAFRPQPAAPSDGPEQEQAPATTSEPTPTETGGPTAPETTGEPEPAPTDGDDRQSGTSEVQPSGGRPGAPEDGETATPNPTEPPQQGPTGEQETAPSEGFQDERSGQRGETPGAG
ncbi:DNA polymerase III subunit gamma/tau domain-containing protein [Bounagaea algeriensis]